MEYANRLFLDIEIQRIVSVESKGNTSTVIALDAIGNRVIAFFSNVLDTRVSTDSVYVERLSTINNYEFLSGQIYEVCNSELIKSIDYQSGVGKQRNLHDILFQDRYDTVFESLCFNLPVIIDAKKESDIQSIKHKYLPLSVRFRGGVFFPSVDALALVNECVEKNIGITSIRSYRVCRNGLVPVEEKSTCNGINSIGGGNRYLNLIQQCVYEDILYELVFNEFSFVD